MLALPKPSKSTISHHGLFHGVLAVCRVITVADFDSKVCFCLSGVGVELSVLLKFPIIVIVSRNNLVASRRAKTTTNTSSSS